MKTKITHTSSERGRVVLALGLLLGLGAAVGSDALAQGLPKPDPEAVTRGSKAWAEQCNRCHNVRNPTELRDSEWEVSVTHMRLIGNIPGEMARDIIAFLKASN